MENEQKKEVPILIRNELRQFEGRIDRKFGVFMESMNDKFKLVFEAFENIYKTLDKHTEMFKDIYNKLDIKADVTELDSLDRRVTKLERKEVRPSRSG